MSHCQVPVLLNNYSLSVFQYYRRTELETRIESVLAHSLGHNRKPMRFMSKQMGSNLVNRFAILVSHN